MRLADLVAIELRRAGVSHVFTVVGGANLHLLDAVDRLPEIDIVCVQHEQAAAMAADAYARVTGRLGVATTTSGPGAVNLLTGVCTSFFDSTPTLLITGQVTSGRLRRGLNVRQLGFQETQIVEMFRPVTKNAMQLTKPEAIFDVLASSLHLAQDGRPGPVLIDIPDDFWTKDVVPNPKVVTYPSSTSTAPSDILMPLIEETFDMLNRAQRPVLILGNGVRLSKAQEDTKLLVDRLNIPFACTRSANDLIDTQHPLNSGSFGIHGTRASNFIIQNADFILSIGARLHPQQTGNPPATFARAARKVIVDIDPGELNKFDTIDMKCDQLILANAMEFIRCLLEIVDRKSNRDVPLWRAQVQSWKERFGRLTGTVDTNAHVNPYYFLNKLSQILTGDEVVVTSAGNAMPWMTQVFAFKGTQRFIADFNNFAMGYDLPGSVGASFADIGRNIICITGEGSLQMNVQELATIKKHNLPIKIFVLDNGCYGMINQTQDQWFNSKYFASSLEGGLAEIDVGALANAYKIDFFEVVRHDEIVDIVDNVMKARGPVICRVCVPSAYRVVPQVKAGHPIEDTSPLLDRDVFSQEMIIDTIS